MRAAPPHPVTPDLILRAYAAGLFPMAEDADDPELFWVDPERRGIFPLDGIAISRSLRKVIRSDRFAITFDTDFKGVIDACAAPGAGRDRTWINGPIRELYHDLFQRGFVHTVEAWCGDVLVGGLYGVAIGGAFFGESMFHRKTDASKVSLAHLAAVLIRGGFTLLDTQFVTPHLAGLGAVEVPRRAYHAKLAVAMNRSASFPRRGSCDAFGGADVLAILDDARGQRLPDGSLPPNSVP